MTIATVAQITFCVELISGAENIIYPPITQSGSGKIKKGLIRPHLVRVRSMIRPEIVSSRAS